MVRKIGAEPTNLRLDHSMKPFQDAERRVDFIRLLESIEDISDRMMIAFLLKCAKENVTVEEITKGIPIAPEEVKKLYLEIVSRYSSLRALPLDYDELREYLHKNKPYKSAKDLGITRPLDTASVAVN